MGPPAPPTNGHILQELRLSDPGMLKQQDPSRTTPKTRLRDKFRWKSSNQESSPQKTSAYGQTVRYSTETTHVTRRFRSPPMTSPQAAIDENNPWATQDSKEISIVRDPTLEKPFLSSNDRGNMYPTTAANRYQSSSASNVRILSPYELHRGFCKDAYKMQVHEEGAMIRRNQSVTKTGEQYYWACCSSKCAFEGPLRLDGKKWAFDNKVRQFGGIHYRWSFLAKAHVTLSRVKDGKYDCWCVFCIHSGYECPVFHGVRELLEHVRTPRGQTITEVMLQSINCINDRIASKDEDFDVNQIPLEAHPQSASGEDINQSTYPASTIITASDGASWIADDGTMADKNPWGDVT
ncbi:MAG: hypothetical protein LQ338_005391 [Usnochroma carphineum]|nr:MAG: hypothetical protein LQ338_005391 [Usnochroma carphineum]